jgi:hypothetical protein
MQETAYRGSMEFENFLIFPGIVSYISIQIRLLMYLLVQGLYLLVQGLYVLVQALSIVLK